MNILIADDHELIANGVISYFQNTAPDHKLFTAKNKSELIFQLKEQQIDIIIQDLQFGKDDAREILSEVKLIQPNVKLLVLSTHTDEFSIKSCISAGYHGYVSKNAPISEILDGIQTVMDGQTFLSSDIKEKLSNSALFGKGANEISLSDREIKILLAIQNEFSTKEIAQQLHLSEKTIEAYRSNLFLKFEVKNVAGLVKKAILNGYI